MCYCRFCILTVLFTFPVSAADPSAQPAREWVDNTGTFRITARLVTADPATQSVQLQLESGEVVNVPLRRLSAADRTYLNSRLISKKSSASPERVVSIRGINWFRDLSDASRAAAGGETPDDDRPIMCFRVLGDLSGFM